MDGCGKPCNCPSYRHHVASIGMQGDRRDVAPKVTTDVHDQHKVDVTEHWSDRVDVTVKVPTIALKTTIEEKF